jgi:peptidoglycan/LPS O-acetylase OafA/YrhL
MTQELRALTSLRMVAALLVFVHHYSGLPPGIVQFRLQALAVEGHVGVSIFLVLSGFLIALAYYTHLQEGRFSYLDYLVKRFARIIPLYWVLLGITFWLRGQDPLSVDALLNWSLLHGYFEALRFSGVMTSWTLTVEFTFYGIAPLVFFTCLLVSRGHSPVAALLRIAGVLLAWTVGLMLLGYVLLQVVIGAQWFYGAFMGHPYYLAIYTIFGRFFEFAVGILSALIYMRYRESILRQPALLWTIISSGCVLIIILLIVQMNLYAGITFQAGNIITTGWYFNYPIAVVTGILIVSLTHERSPFTVVLSRAPFVYLGRISYALYLLQGTPIAGLTQNLLNLQHPSFLLTFYVALNIVAALFYELIEKPSRAAVLWLWGRFRKTRASPQVVAVRGESVPSGSAD